VLPSALRLFFDGLCEPNPGGVATYGWSLVEPETGKELAHGKGQVKTTEGRSATNNVAEYYGVGHGLHYLKDQGWQGSLEILGDSQLVVKQLTGAWECHADGLRELLDRCRLRLTEVATDWTAAWVPREQNTRADELTQAAYREVTGHEVPERPKKAPRKAKTAAK
jgi:ribonuclease HI